MPTDVFYFGPDLQPPAEAQVLRFRGDVRFAGHHGLLFIRICNPWLHMNPNGRGFVSVQGAEPGGGDRLTFATFLATTGDDQRSSFACHDVRLTQDGADTFFGVYSSEEPLDDMTVFPR